MLKYWIWLSEIPGVGPVLQKRLLQTFLTPKRIYEAEKSDLMAIDGIAATTANKIKKQPLDRAYQIIENLERTKIGTLTFENKNYPAKVKECKCSPILLYYRGAELVERGVSIIGSRRCTSEAKRATVEISTALAKGGFPIISGLAKGIDSYAHRSCLNAKGYTIAILAHGLDLCYPREHQSLFEMIIEQGTVISRYPPGTRPHPKYFVERNALISAFSTKIIIIQASENSGALTTASFAKEQGRDVFIVPHSIYIPEARGSNALLTEGATPILNTSSLGLTKELPNKSSHRSPSNAHLSTLTTIQKKILLNIPDEPISIQLLSHKLKLSEKDLIEQLSILELESVVMIQGTMVRCLSP
ncbi:DNA-processing protein DprA [Anaerobacillus sp. MEB173]|uniref:DNA-processing protein DprA n=1 Tax=Anaerobacillus sp. MEB173 TaxID=3383345 RepID=UPI003F93B53E